MQNIDIFLTIPEFQKQLEFLVLQQKDDIFKQTQHQL